MKTFIKNIFALIAISSAFIACSNDDDTTQTTDELEGLTLFQTLENDTHTIELYSSKGYLEQGYNEITLRIQDKTSEEYVTGATISWNPIMHMTTMMHSCPRSAISKVTPDGTTYSGYLMFQMAQNDFEYWDLTFTYTINGVEYSVTDVIDVTASSKKVVNSFIGSDGVRYLLAYIEPSSPQVAINDLVVGVWKMESMMNFPVVDGYTVKIDPRMPSMGNHSSPNNIDATQAISNEFYFGKLTLTMTGYWKINLQLANEIGEILKGEEITTANESSSIYFEIEF